MLLENAAVIAFTRPGALSEVIEVGTRSPRPVMWRKNSVQQLGAAELLRAGHGIGERETLQVLEELSVGPETCQIRSATWK